MCDTCTGVGSPAPDARSPSLSHEGRKRGNFMDRRPRRQRQIRSPRLYADGRRRYLHHLVWESAFGPVPTGHIIHHRNGNPRDNYLENLQLLPMSQHSSEHLAERNRSQRLHIRCSLCPHAHHARGYCLNHYDEWRRERKRIYDRERYERRRSSPVAEDALA